MKEPDRAGADQATGEYRDGHQDEHVEWIAVVTERARKEAIVARIVDGTVQDAVEPEDAELLVELVFVALVGRDLDDGGDLGGRVGAGRDVVPGVEVSLRGVGHWVRASW